MTGSTALVSRLNALENLPTHPGLGVIARLVDARFAFHLQFQRRKLAFALSAGPFALRTTPDILAQKDFFRAASAFVRGLGAGGFRLLPAARAFSRPLAVRPAPRLIGSFSPRPTDKEGKGFLAILFARQHLVFRGAARTTAKVIANYTVSLGRYVTNKSADRCCCHWVFKTLDIAREY